MFPIQTTTLQAGSTSGATMVPGTMRFYRLDTSTSAATVQLTFGTPTGAALPAHLHPQVTVFRLP